MTGPILSVHIGVSKGGYHLWKSLLFLTIVYQIFINTADTSNTTGYHTILSD